MTWSKLKHLCTIVFAGVHDSFWTHACDVEKMNQILREKFVELYDMPILENVRIYGLIWKILPPFNKKGHIRSKVYI